MQINRNSNNKVNKYVIIVTTIIATYNYPNKFRNRFISVPILYKITKLLTSKIRINITSFLRFCTNIARPQQFLISSKKFIKINR